MTHQINPFKLLNQFKSSYDFPFSIAAGIEKGTKNRYNK